MCPFPPTLMLLRLITFCILLSGMASFMGCRQPTEGDHDLAAEAKKFEAERMTAISGSHRIDVVEQTSRNRISSPVVRGGWDGATGIARSGGSGADGGAVHEAGFVRFGRGGAYRVG